MDLPAAARQRNGEFIHGGHVAMKPQGADLRKDRINHLF
jgi:hypothetical protein